jgi:hypothetical protein
VLTRQTRCAGYEHGQLARVSIINFDVWNSGNGTRPSRQFELKTPKGIKSVQVQALTCPGGMTATRNLSWAGETWTYASNGIGQKVGPETAVVDVKDGHAQINVGASEAVMIHMMR